MYFVSTSKAGGDIAYWLSDHSEQEFNNPFVCKESLKLKIFLLLPVSVFPLLLTYCHKWEKIVHGATKKWKCRTLLKRLGNSTGKAQEKVKGLGQGLYCKIGQKTWILWEGPGHMVEVRYVWGVWNWRDWGGRTEGDRGTFSLHHPSATCAWKRWSMLKISAILPPLSFPTWCQDNGNRELWMCLMYYFGRLNTELSQGADIASRTGNFNERCLWNNNSDFFRALSWKTTVIYPSLPSTSASVLTNSELLNFNFLCFCLFRLPLT